MSKTMTIAAAARATGLTPDTLRYYERIGILRRAQRDRAGRRVFDESDVVGIAFVARLGGTGMPLTLVRTYAELVRKGKATLPQRRALLLAHRATVEGELARYGEMLKAIDTKLQLYDAPKAAESLPSDACKTARPLANAPRAGHRRKARATELRRREV